MINKDLWEKEHKIPTLFPQIHATDPSGGIERLYNFFKRENIAIETMKGLEIGCGKGRNSIWFAEKGLEMYGFDFSPTAVAEATMRADISNQKVQFVVSDIVKDWPYKDVFFDVVIDCFSMIEICENIDLVFKEIDRVVKPGGYFFMYTNSNESEVYKKFNIPHEQSLYQYPDSAKIERTFDIQYLHNALPNFSLIKEEAKESINYYNGTQYSWHHLWLLYQKNNV